MAIGSSSAGIVRVLRFDRVQRAVHWVNAALFAILIVTAIPLYFGTLFGVGLPRHVVEEVHLWAGLALPVPLLVSIIGPWSRAMRADVGRISLWTRDELRWLATLGRSELAGDKLNPGQKLNAIFVSAMIVVMLFSGVVLQWFRYFPVSWRVGATFVHDVFFWIVVIVVLAHIYLALTHRDSLRSIFRGWVSRDWAERHATRWFDEVRSRER